MPVSTKHQEYINNVEAWRLGRDCIAGSKRIKEARPVEGNREGGLRNALGTLYLPAPNPDDLSRENIDRYEAYKKRAVFVNFSAHTRDGFLGMYCRKESRIELPNNIDYLSKNSDGSGLSLEGFIKKTASDLMEVGRAGWLADYPISNGGTLAQTGSLQATLKYYNTESIRNWREEVINGVKQLSLIVLSEPVEVTEDGFDYETKEYYRVLYLDSGVYKQRLYNDEEELLVDENGESDIIPRQFNGSAWSFIPFQFIGAENNDPNPDKALLYDLFEVNIGHYRNSADFEESSFICGQPTYAATGLSTQWAKEILKGGIQVGSRKGIPLPVGADLKLVQANPNQMPDRAMELKEVQMVKIGAKVITDAGGVETAEAAKIRFAGQNSKLGIAVANIESALKNAIEWIGLFMGVLEEPEIELNRQFYEASVNPQLLVAQIQLMDRGVIGKTDIRDSMRKQSILSRTDEEIDEENGQIDPLQ